jgi:serine/threonine-protein kinase
MSVEASEFVSEVWTRWQGHVINGVFPLGRYLGGSEHSGVFLTKSAARPAEVAIKLVPTNRALAESQLPRWKRAGGLAHPHLLRLFEWGGCQLDGLPYLYCVMEYADQTLAQLLQHRALTDDEAREMLLPTLDALAFLHGRNLLQGQLKPANILVVGDQLKLASDTIRRVSERVPGTNTSTVYDPPEAQQGSSSPAGDIWALGVSLFEALTRRAPSGLGQSGDVRLPADFSPAFHELVVRCLSPSPEDRPDANELVAWARGRSAGSAPPAATQPLAPVAPEASTPEPLPVTAPQVAPEAPPVTAPPQVAPEPPPVTALPQVAPEPPPLTAPPQITPETPRPAPSGGQYPKPRVLLTVILGAIVILVLGWITVPTFRTHGAAVPTPPPVQEPAGSASQTPGGAAPVVAEVRPPVSAVSTSRPGRTDLAASPSRPHEEIPDVPWGARRTIRGHIKVWVRVIVDQDGSVFAADTDRTGPSGYFQRVAIEAAKKWTFPPVDTPARRLMQVRFDFTRDGTTGRAVTLR